MFKQAISGLIIMYIILTICGVGLFFIFNGIGVVLPITTIAFLLTSNLVGMAILLEILRAHFK